jgi:hypothetical protein
MFLNGYIEVAMEERRKQGQLAGENGFGTYRERCPVMLNLKIAGSCFYWQGFCFSSCWLFLSISLIK